MLPFLLLFLAGAGTVAGAVKAVEGLSDMDEAQRMAKDAQDRARAAEDRLMRKQDHVRSASAAYGERLVDCQRVTLKRFVDFVEALGHVGRRRTLEILEGVDITPIVIKEYKESAIHAAEIAAGLGGAVAAGAGASMGTTSLIGLFGTASTGTAIGSLSGAAATNATLAWLGGGSLAAGGGGVALGSLVLGSIVLAPAVLVTGFVVAGKGAEARRKAAEYVGQVEVEIQKIDVAASLLERVKQRIHELDGLVQALNRRAVEALDGLDPRRFDPNDDSDARRFQLTGQLVKALADVMRTPVLDAAGERLTEESAGLRAKYLRLTE
jgi:hypothetical protein